MCCTRCEELKLELSAAMAEIERLRGERDALDAGHRDFAKRLLDAQAEIERLKSNPSYRSF